MSELARSIAPAIPGLAAAVGGDPRACVEAALDEVEAWLGLAAPRARRGAIGRARADLRARLDDVAPPAPGDDVVAALHHAIVPRRDRHVAGEFYTPRWLAEHLLDAVGYTGDAPLDGALIDPTCGSGTFLALALARYRAAAERAGWSAAAILGGAARAIAGVDRSPLAVRAARLNLRLALRDLGELAPTVIEGDALAAPPRLPRARWLVGNPPWLRWSQLDAAERARLQPASARTGLVPSARFGGAELDVSAVIVHAAAAAWLAPRGTLGFVLPQILLQSPAARAFRAFALADGTMLAVRGVDDWSAARPWDGVAARPASLVADAGTATSYPVQYRVWRRSDGARLDPGATWAATSGRLEADTREAMPLGPDARWAIASPGARAMLAALAGDDPHHQGRKGITCDLNGAYFVTIARARAGVADARADLAPRGFSVEAALCYPLLKGAAEIRAFSVTDNARFAIVPNRTIRAIDPALPPHARRHFARLRARLLARSTYRTRMVGAPYWAVYNVGDYTFAPYKVVWAEQSAGLAAAVVGAREVPGAGARPVVPDHKVYFVPFDEPAPAHHLCALLNAPSVRAAIDAFTVKLQVGTLFRHVHLPRFDPGDATHRALAQLSERAHAGTAPDPDAHDALARRALGVH